MQKLFDRNFLMKVFNAVSVGERTEKPYEDMQVVHDTVAERMGGRLREAEQAWTSVV